MYIDIFDAILFLAYLENEYRASSPSAKLNTGGLQQHLWTNKTRRSEALLGGMFNTVLPFLGYLQYFSCKSPSCVCNCRFAWSTPSTCCSAVTSKRPSAHCLWLKVGGTEKSRPLSIGRLNWSRLTGVCWIMWCGVKRGLPAPAKVKQYTAKHLIYYLDTALTAHLFSNLFYL